VWLDDPESYSGCSIATGRTFHAREIKRDDPNTKAYKGPPDWGWAWG